MTTTLRKLVEQKMMDDIDFFGYLCSQWSFCKSLFGPPRAFLVLCVPNCHCPLVHRWKAYQLSTTKAWLGGAKNLLLIRSAIVLFNGTTSVVGATSAWALGGLNVTKQNNTKQRVCHTMALPFTLKSILRQKKNDRNSNISPCKNIIFKKILLNKPKSFKIS
jgi:hypothetical protein